MLAGCSGLNCNDAAGRDGGKARFFSICCFLLSCVAIVVTRSLIATDRISPVKTVSDVGDTNPTLSLLALALCVSVSL